MVNWTLRRVVAVPSERSFLAIDTPGGPRGQRYACLADDFCTCPTFLREAVRCPTPVLCKHLLAARIAPALRGKPFEVTTVTDAEYSAHLAGRFPAKVL